MIPRPDFLRAMLSVAASPRGNRENRAAGSPATQAAGPFLIATTTAGLQITHRSAPQRILFASPSGLAFVAASESVAQIREFGTPYGSFAITDDPSVSYEMQRIESVTTKGTSVTLGGQLVAGTDSIYCEVSFTAVSDRQLRFVVNLFGPNAGRFNRIVLRCVSDPTEAFFGFGQQLTFFNQKGKLLPIIVQEHGIGRGQPILTGLVDRFADGSGGDPYSTEAPAPHYITSRLRSLFLEGTQYSTFDLRAPNHLEIKSFSSRLSGRILFGTTPLELIEEYTTYAGRMRALPDWIHTGAVIGLQGGTQVVRANFAKLARAGVPMSALWLQDWTGTRKTSAGTQLWWNWHLDELYYPNWPTLIDDLRRRGMRMLLYLNEFLSTDLGHNDLYLEAQRQGYLVENHDGSEFRYKNSDFYSGMVDFNNPAARRWFKAIIKSELIGAANASGWMADFGEALPFDAKLYGGTSGALRHNRYPVEWARVNREAIQEAGRGNDLVFFNRSGFTRSPGASTLFWLGDQLQNWSEFDGIKSALVGMLSGGISGFSLLHCDTGGYVTLSAPFVKSKIPVVARSKELLMRWVEMNAFTCVLRTHEGLQPEISAQVYSDAETIAHFRTFAKIYAALAFYRKPLVLEAAQKGYPVVRHPFLHYPGDPATHALRYQFMLGADFMVAPVLDEGARDVRLYLPAGSWTNFWTQAVDDEPRGRWRKIPAPLGNPGLFFKSSSPAGKQLREKLLAGDVQALG